MSARGAGPLLLLALAVLALALAPAARATPGKVDLFTTAAVAGSEGGIAAGPDGNLWFTAAESHEIGRITPAGAVTTFPLSSPKSRPGRIATGPDGALWFLEEVEGDDRIGRLETTGAVTTFDVPGPNSYLDAISPGGDGNVWFTKPAANRVGRITPAGTITEFPVPTAGSQPAGLALGSDGNLWMAEGKADQVARIGPDGAIAEFALPAAEEGPRDIAAAADGALWTASFRPGALLRVTGAGATTSFPLPASFIYGPGRLAVDPLGNVWFTNEYNRLGRMTPAGRFSEYRVFQPPPCGEQFWLCDNGIAPVDLTVGPDGQLWFLGANVPGLGGPPAGRGSVLGRLDPSAPPPAPAPTKAPSLRGRAVVGAKLRVDAGAWTHAPTAYDFTWLRCGGDGKRCRTLAVSGPVHQVVSGDADRVLRVEVSATNAAGTGFASTAPSRLVGSGPAPLRVRIASRIARLGGERVRLRLACAGGSRGTYCSGRLRLGASARARAVFGARRYRLAAGRRAWIAVPLSARGRAQLRVGGRVLATATLWGGRRAAREVTLVRPRGPGSRSGA